MNERLLKARAAYPRIHMLLTLFGHLRIVQERPHITVQILRLLRYTLLVHVFLHSFINIMCSFIRPKRLVLFEGTTHVMRSFELFEIGANRVTYFASHNRWIDTPWSWSFDSTGQWLRARHRHFLPLSPHTSSHRLPGKKTHLQFTPYQINFIIDRVWGKRRGEV